MIRFIVIVLPVIITAPCENLERIPLISGDVICVTATQKGLRTGGIQANEVWNLNAAFAHRLRQRRDQEARLPHDVAFDFASPANQFCGSLKTISIKVFYGPLKNGRPYEMRFTVHRGGRSVSGTITHDLIKDYHMSQSTINSPFVDPTGSFIHNSMWKDADKILRVFSMGER